MEALHIMDPRMIKADENPVTLRLATPLPVPEPFAHELATEGLTPIATITPAAPEHPATADKRWVPPQSFLH